MEGLVGLACRPGSRVSESTSAVFLFEGLSLELLGCFELFGGLGIS